MILLAMGCGGSSADGPAIDGGAGDSSTSQPDGGGTAQAPKGLDAYCALYIECGGSYYADKADCVKRTADWYAICAKSSAALDAYGDCMVATRTCATWNPNGDPPGSVTCGNEWSALQAQRSSCGS
ncbi:MAG: hypothetical protein ABI200_02580 [Gaiellales bacterium]